MSIEIRQMIDKVKNFKQFINESSDSGYLKLQRGQKGEVNDCWDLRTFNGQHGEGVYAFLYGDKAMADYYTSNGETVHTFQIPKKYVKDLSTTNYKWDYWTAKKYMYDNPQYKAFIFKHVGHDIPTSKEVLIIDQSIIEILK